MTLRCQILVALLDTANHPAGWPNGPERQEVWRSRHCYRVVHGC